MMTKNVEIGRRGEDLALADLERRGMKLLARNFRAGHREIDLVMESEDRIHFVEVKTLSSSLSDPAEKVDMRKMKLLASAAGAFLSGRSLDKEVQFDVVSVVKKGTDFEIEYLPDAFIPVYYR